MSCSHMWFNRIAGLYYESYIKVNMVLEILDNIVPHCTILLHIVHIVPVVIEQRGHTLGSNVSTLSEP